MKTSELTGTALNWAVAKCEGIENQSGMWAGDKWVGIPYITDWAQGGTIIEREGIDLECHLGYWASSLWPNKPTTVTPVNAAKYRIGRIKLSIRANGPTPLIAAMRCYVASKLGDDVAVPEGLL